MNTQPESNFPKPPTYEDVLKQLQPLLDLIREGIEAGTTFVQEFSEWDKQPIDFALAPNLVRYKAKAFLSARGQSAEDEPGFAPEDIPNNGICTRVPGFEVRTLKSTDDGDIPMPGVSVTRQNLYNQVQARFPFSPPTWGLIVHWLVDGDYGLLRMAVAMPESYGKDETGKMRVNSYFDQPFWIKAVRPCTTTIDEPPQAAANADVEGIVLDDSQEKTGEDSKDE